MKPFERKLLNNSPSGLGEAPALEVISKLPSVQSRVPPVLFVHGAWHGAWCWNEGVLDYFAERGFAAHAMSLRGHGASGGTLRATRIRDYVEDLARVVKTLPSLPVLVGHSMGGFVVQKYLQDNSVPAAVLLASVPPTGVWRMLIRAMRNQPLDVLKCNLTLSLWPMISDVSRARRLLFSEAMKEEDLRRHYIRLQNEAWYSYLDTLAFDLVNPKRVTTPVIVVGGGDDAFVRPTEIAVTAKAYNVTPIMVAGVAHDMMLDIGWRRVAAVIVKELDVYAPIKVQMIDAQNNAA